MNAVLRWLSACWWFLAKPLPVVLQRALAILVLNIPLLIVSIIALQEVGDDIAFSRGELRGASLIRPAIELMQIVQRHRGAADLAAAGNPSAPARIAILKADIATRLDQLNVLVRSGESADPTSTAAALGTINENWIAVLQHKPDANDSGFDASSQVVASLILWQQTVAEEYGLVLDADPASYHLSQALIFQIPNWIENAAQSRGFGAGALERHALPADLHDRLLELEQRQKLRQDEVIHELDHASEHRPSLRASLQPILLAAMESSRAFFSALQRDVLEPPQPVADPDAFYAQGSEAVDRIYLLAQAGYDSFEAIVRMRLRALLFERYLILLADGAGFLLVAMALGVARRLRARIAAVPVQA